LHSNKYGVIDRISYFRKRGGGGNNDSQKAHPVQTDEEDSDEDAQNALEPAGKKTLYGQRNSILPAGS
jgi:hypothetical protein